MQSLGRTGMSSSAPEVQIHSQDNQAAPGASLPTATCSAQPEPLVSREWVTVLKCSDDQSNNTGEPGPGCAHPQPSAPYSTQIPGSSCQHFRPLGPMPHSHIGWAKPPRGMSQNLCPLQARSRATRAAGKSLTRRMVQQVPGHQPHRPRHHPSSAMSC